MKSKLLCILGETASGKDSITNTAIEKLSEYDIRKICSYTDRPKRDSETEGVEHYFVTTDEFNKLKDLRKDDILGYTRIKNNNQTSYNGYQYMALTDELEKAHIYIIDYEGLKYLKRIYSDLIDIISVYIYCPLSERLNRAKLTRSDFETEFKNRVIAEECQFKEFRESHLYDYIINNLDGKFEESVNKLSNIMKDELIDKNILNRPTTKQ